MKTISKITLLLFIMSVSCKAQTIIDITNFRSNYVEGAYYKDTNNVLNPFVGTYVMNSGGKMIKIEFRKIEMSESNVYTEDLISGEYQVIENNVQKINTIPRFLDNVNNGWYHSITGNLVITQGGVGCDECVAGEKALRLEIGELSTKNRGFMIVRRIIVNGQQAIKVSLVWELSTATAGYLPPSFPSDDYMLIKEN
jgi:hypothetical protein